MDNVLLVVVVIVALVCFFPVTVNTLDGLRSVDPQLITMMRTLGANRRQILTRVELPSALPFFFSGLKVAVTLSVIGAVVGEFVGSDKAAAKRAICCPTSRSVKMVWNTRE